MKTKRTFKVITATALALILSFGAMTSAFASGDSITWTVNEETAICKYHSELSLGTNTVSIEGDDYYYFDVSDFENGFYKAEITNNPFDYFVAPDKTDDGYEGWGDVELRFTDDTEVYFLNIEDCNDILIGGAPYGEDNVTIEIEYLGSEITAVDFEIEEILIDYDINKYEDGIWFYDNATIEIDGEKVCNIGNAGVKIIADGELKKGENDVKISILGEEIEKTINTGFVTDYIKSIETQELKATVYYDYSADFHSDIYDFTVEFTDGTKQECTDGEVTLPGGREIYVWPQQSIDAETYDVTLIYTAGEAGICSVDVETVKASLKDNATHFKVEMAWRFDTMGYYAENFTYFLSRGDMEMAGIYFNYFISFTGYTFSCAAAQIDAFVRFIF